MLKRNATITGVERVGDGQLLNLLALWSDRKRRLGRPDPQENYCLQY